jgi:hypothetical protein
MAKTHTDARDPVTTQPELPPGIDAPSPKGARERIESGQTPADVEDAIRRLAERVGGMARLREMVNVLAAGDR